MTELKVSVIIPVYQAEKYLTKCLESILNQTYENIEVILIDDGSKDNSLAICNKYKELDSRVFVIKQGNSGVSKARNVGINSAKGDYVFFVDSDDWIENNTLEKLVYEIKENNLDCIGFNYIKEYENYSIKNTSYILEEKIYRGDDCQDVARKAIGLVGEELKNIEAFNFMASPCSKIYKKSIIVDNGIYFEDIRQIGSFEDGLFNIAFFLNCKSFMYKNDYYYHYRKTNYQSITSTYRENVLNKQINQLELIKKVAEIDSNKFFYEAYQNRISFLSMEYFVNVVMSEKKFVEKYREIAMLFKNKEYVRALKNFSLKHLSLKWKMYYFFIKNKMILGIYSLSFIIVKLKRKK